MELPAPWELRESTRYPGRVFYYNRSTRETTWIRPCPYPGNKISWPPAVYVLHILIRDKQSSKPGRLTSQEAEKKLREITKQLLSKKASFEDCADSQSEDEKTNRSGGIIGWLKKGQMPPEFDRVAWQLHVGELSSPTRTELGWHLILRRG